MAYTISHCRKWAPRMWTKHFEKLPIYFRKHLYLSSLTKHTLHRKVFLFSEQNSVSKALLHKVEINNSCQMMMSSNDGFVFQILSGRLIWFISRVQLKWIMKRQWTICNESILYLIKTLWALNLCVRHQPRQKSAPFWRRRELLYRRANGLCPQVLTLMRWICLN